MTVVEAQTTQTTYPAEHYNLLVKAKLIGSGKKFIMATVGEKKLPTLDEQSNTWVESDIYEKDHREAKEWAVPVLNNDGSLKGDWRKGLNADEIKIINEQCNVPIYDADTMFVILSGKEYDLSKPSDMAEYRLLLPSGIVALSKKLISGDQRFYIFSPKEERIDKSKERKLKAEAIKLDSMLSTAEKKEIIQIANFRFKMGLPYDLPDVRIGEIFADMVHEGEYKKVMTAYELPDKAIYLLVVNSLQVGVLFRETDDKISKPNGMVLADDIPSFIDFLKTNDGQRQELIHEIARISQRRLSEESVINAGDDLGLVTTFNTIINQEKDVANWNIEACQQYVKENGWIPTISGAGGSEKWKQLVISIYRAEESKWGYNSLTVVDDTPSLDASKKDVIKNDHLARTTEKDNLLERVKTWERDQCKNFLLANHIEVELKPTHGASKWRNAVTEWVNTLSPDKVIEMMKK